MDTKYVWTQNHAWTGTIEATNQKTTNTNKINDLQSILINNQLDLAWTLYGLAIFDQEEVMSEQ